MNHIDTHEAIWTPECRLVTRPDGKHPYLKEMFRAYLATPEGAHQLDQPPRFSAGFHCSELANETLAELCADTNPADHMNNVRFWFQQLVSVDPHMFTPYTAQIGKTAAQFHDVGENTHPHLAYVAGVAQPPGDIPRGRKTQSQREDEERIRRIAYQTIITPHLPEQVINDIEDIISHRARPTVRGQYTPEDHPLAIVDDALELAHVAGHLGVAGKAVTYTEAGYPNVRLIELSREVYDGSMAELSAYASVFRLSGILLARFAWIADAHSALKTRTVFAA